MSLVLECLEQYGVEMSDTLPAMEGGNLDMITDYMSKEVRDARSKIIKANKLFKQENYKEAEKLYTEAKGHIVACRKRSMQVRTNTLVDKGINTAAIITMCMPIINILTTLPGEIAEMRAMGDSESMVDREKLFNEYGNTSNFVKNYITLRCRKLEIACDDKIKRCRNGNK